MKEETTRRTVLRGIAASGLALGGAGTVAARHNGGNGPPEGSGGGGGNRPEGKGPSGLTGGSGLMVADYTDVPVDEDAGTENDDNTPDARFELGTRTGETIESVQGCDAAEEPSVPNQEFVGYDVTWLDGDGPDAIYVYQQKPVNPGTYNMVDASDCGTLDETGDALAKVGYEPAGEGHTGE